MKLVQRVIPPLESDYLLDMVLAKMIDMSEHGTKYMTADEVFISIDNDCYVEVEDYDPDGEKQYMRLQQVQNNDIESTTKLYAIIDYLSNEYVICVDKNVAIDLRKYGVSYVLGRRFLTEGGYQNLASRNKLEEQRKRQEEQRKEEYHSLTKILTVGTTVAAFATSCILIKDLQIYMKDRHALFYSKICPYLITIEVAGFFATFIIGVFYFLNDNSTRGN